MNDDRRSLQRKVLEDLAFIQIGQDDGGRILNLSEGGLCFELAAPQQINGSLPVWFSLDLRERIEVVGEVAWTDETKRVGGLKFVSLSDKACSQLGPWLSAGSRTDAQFAENKSGAAPLVLSHEHQEKNPPKKSAFFAKVKPSLSTAILGDLQNDGSGFGHSESTWQPNPSSPNANHLVPFEQYRSAVRRQFVLGLVFGILFSFVIAGVVVKVMELRRNSAAVPAAPGQGASNAPTQTESPSSLPTAEPGENTPVSAAAKARSTAQGSPTPSDPFQLASPKYIPSSGRSSDHLATPAQAQSGEVRNSRKTVDTPQQLWSLIQAGDTTAAVTLADLYLRGDGVPANCVQAKVLLMVASKKGNIAAIKKLRQLNETGCTKP
jgi:hypothetical protein